MLISIHGPASYHVDKTTPAHGIDLFPAVRKHGVSLTCLKGNVDPKPSFERGGLSVCRY